KRFKLDGYSPMRITSFGDGGRSFPTPLTTLPLNRLSRDQFVTSPRFEAFLPRLRPVRFSEPMCFMIGGLEPELGQLAGFRHPAVGLFPAGQLVAFGCPVDNGPFIAPFINHPCYRRMDSAITECKHRVQILPGRYSPVRMLPVD